MSDDLTDRGAHDRARIGLTEDHGVAYRADGLSVLKAPLGKVVDEVGNSAKAVREYLAGHPRDRAI